MKKIVGSLCMVLGVVFLGAAILLLSHNRIEDDAAGDAAADVMEEIQEQIGDSDQEATDNIQDGSDIAQSADPVIEVDENGYIGYLSVPVLGLELPVMYECSYPNLRTAPCRYSGALSTYDLVVCGHNYDRHFGRLKTLSIGEEILFTGADGKVRRYEVSAVEIVEPTAIDYVTDSSYELTLYTCTYGGASRVVVRCTQTDMTAEESAREKAVRRAKKAAEARENSTTMSVEDFNDGR